MNIAKLRESPHWSCSAFQTYLTCPLKYRYRYIDKVEPERTSSCFPFGRAIHAALSERARIGRDMSVREVVDVFEDFFKAETDVTPNLICKPNESYDSLMETGIRMLEVACEKQTKTCRRRYFAIMCVIIKAFIFLLVYRIKCPKNYPA